MTAAAAALRRLRGACLPACAALPLCLPTLYTRSHRTHSSIGLSTLQAPRMANMQDFQRTKAQLQALLRNKHGLQQKMEALQGQPESPGRQQELEQLQARKGGHKSPAKWALLTTVLACAAPHGASTPPFFLNAPRIRPSPFFHSFFLFLPFPCRSC